MMNTNLAFQNVKWGPLVPVKWESIVYKTLEKNLTAGHKNLLLI